MQDYSQVIFTDSFFGGEFEKFILGYHFSNEPLERYFNNNDKRVYINSADITDEDIRSAMVNSTLQTTQTAVSLPWIKCYYQMLLDGKIPPPTIVVNNGVIVEGNHRYIAWMLTGWEEEIPQRPTDGGVYDEIRNWSDIYIDTHDWPGRT